MRPGISTDKHEKRKSLSGQRTQEIGRLIENEHLRLRPQSCSQDDLDLLTTRQTLDLVVLRNVAIQTEIDQGLSNEL